MNLRRPEAGGKLSFGVLLASQFASSIGFTFVMPFLPLYVHQLGVQSTGSAAAWAGVLNSAAAVTMALAAPVWGKLADRVGRKPMLLRATLAGSVVVGLMGLVTSPWQLLILRLLQGSLTGTVSAATTLVSTTSPQKSVGSRLGMLQMFIFIASAAGPLFGGIFVDLVGIRASFGVTAVLLASAGVAIWLGVGEERRAVIPSAREEVSPRASLSIRRLLPVLLPLFAVQVATMSITPALPGFLGTLLSRGSQVATWVGVLVGVDALAAAIGSLAAGRLAPRLGPRRIIPIVLLVAGLVSLPEAWSANLPELWVMLFLASLFLGAAVTVGNLGVHEAAPPGLQGSAFGIAASAVSLGNVVGPLSGGFLASGIGIWAPFLIPGVCLLASTLVVRILYAEPSVISKRVNINR